MLKFIFSKKLLLIAVSFDVGTSVGQLEQNPILGRGTFGIRQGSIVCGITGGQLILEHYLRRKGFISKLSTDRINLSTSLIHLGAGSFNLVERGRN